MPESTHIISAKTAPNAAVVVDPLVPDQDQLKAIYLPNMRARFKGEINRLTSGGMAALLGARPETADLSFLMTYLHAYHWLRHNVDAAYRQEVLASFRNPARLFLMQLLLNAKSAEAFVRGYVDHWLRQSGEAPVQRQQVLNLLATQDQDPARLTQHILGIWDELGQFTQDYKTGYAELAHEERLRYQGMLGPEDQERLALVDALPDPKPDTNTRFTKLGIIPAMGCPQTCRHCMFIWRPPKPKNEDAEQVYQLVDSLTDSVLFTGGDLTKQLDSFYEAIRRMRHIRTFAILLNGDFANDREVTQNVLKTMADAIKGRPSHWAPARVLLQISFDEFHQEVMVDKKGRLKERIPVAKIANIVETAPRYAKQIQLALLHKQTALNFSMDVFHKGVFARLANELGERGHQVKILSSAPSSRLKRNPLAPDQQGAVLKDASFILTRHPDAPILLTSSTIDGYGRAAMLDESETVKDRDLLKQVLEQGPPEGESFDMDLMFWFNGWATLFNAVHICLGDLYKDGAQTILARQRKDPLSRALNRFDRRLLTFYAEIKPDLAQLVSQATGPHHLFHVLTEEPKVRLHLTRRLIETD